MKVTVDESDMTAKLLTSQLLKFDGIEYKKFQTLGGTCPRSQQRPSAPVHDWNNQNRYIECLKIIKRIMRRESE
ncbi:hypothetical protein YC2023_022310 [Brassica napus]